MNEYIIDGTCYNTAEKATAYITENISEDYFDEMLDECCPEVEICGYTYSPSLALYKTDETAYRCAYNAYTDSLRPNVLDELEGMEPGGGTLEVYGFDVECVEGGEND